MLVESLCDVTLRSEFIRHSLNEFRIQRSGEFPELGDRATRFVKANFLRSLFPLYPLEAVQAGILRS
jgi:hypothetical protein